MQAGPRSASGRERYAKARHPKTSHWRASSLHESAPPWLAADFDIDQRDMDAMNGLNENLHTSWDPINAP